MDAKIYWLKQKNGEWWGALYPQFYITKWKGKYTLHYIRNTKVQPRTFDIKSIHQGKVLAKMMVDEDIGGD